MTAKTTPLDLVAIRKHILNELDIVSWVLKTQTVQIIKPNSVSRLQKNQQPINQSVPAQIPALQSTNAPSKANAVQSITPSIDIYQNQPSNPPPPNLQTHIKEIQNSPQNSPIQSQPSIIKQAPIIQAQALPQALMGIQATIEKFSLSGISYGDWVILVDNGQLTLTEKAIWQSLTNKLGQHANALCLDIHYPLVMNEYPEYETFLQGTHSLLGFLLKLCANKLSSNQLKLAVLTPLTAGIDLGHLNTYRQPTPTLDDMVHKPDAKKTFWQLLHQP